MTERRFGIDTDASARVRLYTIKLRKIMNKLKRYLGLVFAFVLMALAFAPLGPPPYYPNASKVTPLDNTLLAQLTGTGGRGSPIWLGATDYMNSCPPFQETSKRVVQIFAPERSDCQADSRWVFVGLPQHYEAILTKFDPAIPSLATEYYTNLARWTEAKRSEGSNSTLFGVPAPARLIRDPRLAELELRIGGAMTKYLDSVKSELAVKLYAVHIFVALAGIFLVMSRQQVGAVLLWPFNLLFGAAKVGSKAARNLHDKV